MLTNKLSNLDSSGKLLCRHLFAIGNFLSIRNRWQHRNSSSRTDFTPNGTTFLSFINLFGSILYIYTTKHANLHFYCLESPNCHKGRKSTSLLATLDLMKQILSFFPPRKLSKVFPLPNSRSFGFRGRISCTISRTF